MCIRDSPTGRYFLIATLALLALGVVMVSSAVASVVEPGVWYARVDLRHAAYAVLGAVLLLTLWRIDYRLLARGRRVPVIPAVMLAAALLTAVMVFIPGVGYAVGGYHRWIRIGPPQYAIGFQPSELLKVTLVVFLAAWLSRPATDIRRLRTFLAAVGVICVCTAIVVTQDLGTAVVMVVAATVTLVLAGARWRYVGALTAAGAAGFYAFIVRSPHRMLRIAAMLDPYSATNPSAYQPRQSLLAILTGGWFGRGPGNGICKQGFLPEDSTDFIFAVFCEEWGFAGALLLIALVGTWVFLARRSAVRSGEPFGRLLAGSLGFLVAVQAVLHIAVDVVAAPPTVMGLPFISAGGTALLTATAAAAVIASVSAHPSHASEELSSGAPRLAARVE